MLLVLIKTDSKVRKKVFKQDKKKMLHGEVFLTGHTPGGYLFKANTKFYPPVINVSE